VHEQTADAIELAQNTADMLEVCNALRGLHYLVKLALTPPA
jgi:hypothetical protein